MMQPRRVAIPASMVRPPSRVSGEACVCGGRTMGTSWRAAFISDGAVSAADAAAAIGERLDLVVAQMSPWEAQSDLNRFNRAEAGWVEAPEEFMRVLAAAVDIAMASGGAYNPACAALTDLWGFGPEGVRAHPPEAREIETALSRADWRSIRFDWASKRIFQPGCAAIDLCSIAKGYAVDAAGEALSLLGAKSWLIDIGGELKGRGVKPNGEPWWVSLDSGTKNKAGDFAVALCNLAVATSGVGVRCFTADNRRSSHAIDPRAGCPVTHDLATVSVVQESAMLADAWATALLVLGPGYGPACAEAYDLAARFVFGDGSEIATSRLDEMLN